MHERENAVATQKKMSTNYKENSMSLLGKQTHKLCGTMAADTPITKVFKICKNYLLYLLTQTKKHKQNKNIQDLAHFSFAKKLTS